MDTCKTKPIKNMPNEHLRTEKTVITKKHPGHVWDNSATKKARSTSENLGNPMEKQETHRKTTSKNNNITWKNTTSAGSNIIQICQTFPPWVVRAAHNDELTHPGLGEVEVCRMDLLTLVFHILNFYL